jgi:hypothetical protein
VRRVADFSGAGFVLLKKNPYRVMEEMQTLDPRQDEQAKVHGWRMHVLIEAGYPVELADRLAESDADLHSAVGLVEQGCTPETAVQILL